MINRNIKRFRKACLEFWKYKLSYAVEKGEFDNYIIDFLNGDLLRLSFVISFLPNDVLFMRALLDMDITDDILKKIKKKWRKKYDP